MGTGGYIAAGLVALLAVLAAFYKTWRAGEDSQALKQAQADTKARDIADAVDNDVGAMPPADAREELKRWGK